MQRSETWFDMKLSKPDTWYSWMVSRKGLAVLLEPQVLLWGWDYWDGCGAEGEIAKGLYRQRRSNPALDTDLYGLFLSGKSKATWSWWSCIWAFPESTGKPRISLSGEARQECRRFWDLKQHLPSACGCLFLRSQTWLPTCFYCSFVIHICDVNS